LIPPRNPLYDGVGFPPAEMLSFMPFTFANSNLFRPRPLEARANIFAG
jgi:hypothetical protein